MVILIAAQLCIICEKLRAKTSRPLYYCFLFFFGLGSSACEMSRFGWRKGLTFFFK